MALTHAFVAIGDTGIDRKLHTGAVDVSG
eukprot:COSAG05_NODE_16066_length_354_cov_0.807843_1_plen_28_part_10